jgi:hypothetical protein
MESRRYATELRRGLRPASMLLALAAVMLPAAAPRADDRAAMVTQQARDAVLAMGNTLSAGQFSFHNRTIREYSDPNGQPLHIFHDGTVVVRRPDRLRADVNGDDGTTNFAYDGANLIVYAAELKKYASIPVTGDIEQMLKTAESRLGLDFPLADFITGSPGKAFLGGVTYGVEINTVSIGGRPCSHLLFTQPPGIELELWLEKGEHAVPRRLIVTYRSLPGEPRFVAEMSDWNFAVRPSADDFTLRVPDGAERVSVLKEEAK